MIPYIVRADIRHSSYMSEEDREFDDIRIVMAENEDEAREKYQKYWEDQNLEYCQHFYVQSQVMETVI